jgi:hypothetical protein
MLQFLTSYVESNGRGQNPRENEYWIIVNIIIACDRIMIRSYKDE